MNLFKGLEKFGLKTEGTENLFEEEKRTNASTEQGEAKEEIPSEESFLLEKSVRCTVCDKVFKTKMIKNGRVKRLEPDFDLRPRFMYIDTLKYDVASCPNCGYTAMNRYFEHLSSVQIKLIKEKICANFKPRINIIPEHTCDICSHIFEANASSCFWIPLMTVYSCDNQAFPI